MQKNIDEFWMTIALNLAQQAFREDEVPVGCVIVHQKYGLLCTSYNQKESFQNPLYHAEVLAIQKASQMLHTWRLSDCTLYVTLEPCIMCCGAIIHSRISRVVFGTFDPKTGGVSSLYHLLQDSRLNHQCEVEHSILKESCSQILKDYFKKKRKTKKLLL